MFIYLLFKLCGPYNQSFEHGMQYVFNIYILCDLKVKVSLLVPNNQPQ